MSKNVIEELSRMFYLLEHKRGVVISEQEAPTAGTTPAPTAGTIPAPTAETTPAPTTTPPPPSTTQEYVVQKGDTLGKIGQKFGVQWKDIASLNQIKNVNLIRVGQKLKIPGKTQGDVTQTQTDYVSAAGTDVENLITQLFAKMPSFKTFGKYKDAGGMLKGVATNLTVDELKAKVGNMLLNLPINGFKFYPATEGRPFTKETYNVLTPIGRTYVTYLNDVSTLTPTTASTETTTASTETETISGVTQELKVARETKRADKRICRIINKSIKNNTPMGSVLGDVCQVLETCKTNGFIDKSVTLESCKKVEAPVDDQGTTQEKQVTGGKIPIQVDSSETSVETSTGV